MKLTRFYEDWLVWTNNFPRRRSRKRCGKRFTRNCCALLKQCILWRMEGKTTFIKGGTFLLNRKKMYIIDILLAVDFIVLALSGFAIHFSDGKVWAIMHSITAVLCIVLVVLHIRRLSVNLKKWFILFWSSTSLLGLKRAHRIVRKLNINIAKSEKYEEVSDLVKLFEWKKIALNAQSSGCR